MSTVHPALDACLRDLGPLAVAVSGGIDSLTLATFAHRTPGTAVTAFHATSPAVPAHAAERVRRWADTTGIDLVVVDSGEFDDPRYVANPVDRCRFCKTDLYGAIRARTTATIVSGTNVDDLGEWRPGLQAAARAGVRHPYVEAGVDKAGVRALARALGLGLLADLPAAPCLASRVETGLPIVAEQLRGIDRVEEEVTRRAGPGDIRCRLRAGSVVIETADAVAARLGPADRAAVAALVAECLGDERPVRFEAYRRGAAFVGVPLTRAAPAGTAD